MAKNTIKVTLLGDNKDLARALNGASTDVDSFGSKAKKAFGVGALAIGAAGAAAIAFGPGLVEAGSKLDALGVKSATVFGDALGDVEAWAGGVAGSMGLTQAQLTGAAAGFGDLLKPMGFTSEEAASMSVEMLDLSGALSAWSGGQVDATEAADVLAKAMLGEREGLKGLGISISEADVQARLAAKGQEDLTGAALEQAKALATQELILEKSTDAQTAWADGSMDGVKAQNEASASVEQLKENFVRGIYPALQKILPVIQRVATWIGDRLPGAFAFAERVGNKLKDMFDFLGRNINVVLPVLSGFAIAIGIALVPAFLAWAASAGAAALATMAAAAPFIAIGAAIAAVAAGLVWAYQNVDWFRAAVDKVADVLVAGFKIALEATKVAVDVVWQAIQTASSWLQTAWNKTEALRSLMALGFKAAFEVAKTQIDLVKTALTTAASWLQTAWNKSDSVRSLLAGGFKLAFEGAKTVVDNAKSAIETAAGWIQTAWNKSDALRSLMAAGFRAAVIVVKNQFNFLKTALERAAGWIQTAWDKSDALRSLFVGTFKTAVSGIKTAFNGAKTAVEAVASAIQSVINKANTAINVVRRIPIIGGGGPSGSISLPTKHTGGFVGHPTGAPRDIPIMAQQGEYVMSRSEVAANGRAAGRPIVINLMDRFQVEAIVSQRDADLLIGLEAGMRA